MAFKNAQLFLNGQNYKPGDFLDGVNGFYWQWPCEGKKTIDSFPKSILCCKKLVAISKANPTQKVVQASV